MSNNEPPDPNHSAGVTPWAALPRSSKLAGAVAVLCLVVAIVAAILAKKYPGTTPPGATNTLRSPTPAATSPPALAQPPSTQSVRNPAADLPAMAINQAVMVTVELDFGPQLPGIAEALKAVERRHQPEDGIGRTFAILDAYGGPTPDGKKLHLSMHVSTEKPGIGALVFKPTGAILWQSRIVPGTNTPAFTGKNLTLMLTDETGKTQMVDGSGNPVSLLDARMRDSGRLVREVWPDDAEREVTCIYSACGCPVKFMARRLGERTTRTKELPVIFPDDPAVVQVISRLMGW